MNMLKLEKRRPVFFNPARIQMPVGALTSITHRITGILLAAGIPFGIYILDLSLQSDQSWSRVVHLLDQWAFKAVAIVFDFVRPAFRCRRSIDALRQTGIDERDGRTGRPHTLGTTPR